MIIAINKNWNALYEGKLLKSDKACLIEDHSNEPPSMLEEDSFVSDNNDMQVYGYDNSNMRNSDKYFISSGLLFDSGVKFQMASPKHKHNISDHTHNSSNLVEEGKLVFPIMEDGGTGGASAKKKHGNQRE
jgi:hypothetical protein